MKDWNAYLAQTTIWTKWENICLSNSAFLKCDINKDKIPDLCDEDIDGDKIPNFIWLIKFDRNDCNLQII